MNAHNESTEQRADYDPQTGTYRVYHDWKSNSSVADTILNVISSIESTQLSELDPLHNLVDTDSLNGIFEPRDENHPRGNGYISFTVHGYDVVFRATGVVEIHTPDSKYSGQIEPE